MEMNRRGFLKAFAGAAVVAAVPIPNWQTGFVPVAEYSGLAPAEFGRVEALGYYESVPEEMHILIAERMQLMREMIMYGLMKGGMTI
jgi:hypothetical protein